MARAFHTDGTEPVRTRTIKRDDGIDLELPYCNICEAEMDDIRLSVLLFWRPGWKYTRKYPSSYGAFLCEKCREEMGFGADQYIMVPCTKDEDMIEALKARIAVLEAAKQPS